MKIYSVVVSEYYSNDIVSQSSFHNTSAGAIREAIMSGIIISENDLNDFHIAGYEAAVITRELIIDGDDCPVTIVTGHDDDRLTDGSLEGEELERYKYDLDREQQLIDDEREMDAIGRYAAHG